MTRPQARTTSAAILATLCLACAPAIGLGIGRFAYALLLPDMRQDLEASYLQVSWLAASNSVGYLAGALATPRALRSIRHYDLVLWGSFACMVSIFLCASTSSLLMLNFARLIAGIGGGLAFVSGGVLVAALADRHPQRGALLLGLFYGGAGLGIAMSAASLWVIPSSGHGWQKGWLVLGGLSALLCALILLARGMPSPPRPISNGLMQVRLNMGHLLLAYSIFGAGYIIYMTFMIEWIETHAVASPTLFWVIIGISAFLSPWLWQQLLPSAETAKPYCALTFLTACASALPLLSDQEWVLHLSAGLFGSTFFAVVAATTSFVRRNHPQEQWPRAIALLTLFFSFGQTLGPIVAGTVGDWHGSLDGSLGLSTLLLALSSCISTRQRNNQGRRQLTQLAK